MPRPFLLHDCISEIKTAKRVTDIMARLHGYIVKFSGNVNLAYRLRLRFTSLLHIVKQNLPIILHSDAIGMESQKTVSKTLHRLAEQRLRFGEAVGAFQQNGVVVEVVGGKRLKAGR